MFRFIETIRIFNGKVENLSLHNERFNQTRRDCLKIHQEINLADHIILPSTYQQGLVKCKITYSETVESITFSSYTIRPVRSLKLVHHPNIDYSYKCEDRSLLHQLFGKRGNCDDIIIIKNDLVTDSYYANLVFENDNGFYTPTTSLLQGIKRAKLLSEGIIQKAKIGVKDLKNFRRVHLINAMLDIGQVVVEVKRLKT